MTLLLIYEISITSAVAHGVRARDIDDGVKVLINEKVSAVSFPSMSKWRNLINHSETRNIIVTDNIVLSTYQFPEFCFWKSVKVSPHAVISEQL